MVFYKNKMKNKHKTDFLLKFVIYNDLFSKKIKSELIKS